MRWSTSIWLVCASILVEMSSPARTDAQSVHLTPPVIPLLPDNQGRFPTLLKITPDTSPSATHVLRAGSKLRVYGGRLWIISADGRVEAIQTAARSMEDIVNTINAKYPGATAVTRFPEYDGRYLDNMGPKTLADSAESIAGTLGGPLVDATLGGVFALSDVDDRSSGGTLFSNGGIQLDLVGQKALSSDLYLRLRMVFSSNDPQPVSAPSDQLSGDGVDSSADAEEPTLTTIIENAERFAFGGLIDWFVVNRSHTKVGVMVEYEMAWNAFDPLGFPDVVISDTLGVDTLNVVDLYPADRVSLVRRKVNRVLPASTILFGPTVRFPAISGLSVHALLNVGWSERFRRRIDYAASRNPPSESLADSTTSSMEGIWRVGMGMTLGSALDIRADATGPLRDGQVDPILRVFVSKDFTLKR